MASLAKNAGTGTTTTSPGTLWTRPDLITNSDNLYATCGISSLSQTAELRATGFDFTIPIASTIDGVIVSIERKASASSSIVDYEVGLLSNSLPAGGTTFSGGSYWGTTDATQTYGTPGELWALTLTPALINSSGFGAYLRAENDSYVTTTASVDLIYITVYYTLAGIEYGTTNVGDIYYGTTKIQKIYHGTTEIV